MAYLIPQDVARKYSGDTSMWNGYEMIESAVDDGPVVHQALIQDRLNILKDAEDCVQINSIVTIVFEKDPPNNKFCYLTTIWFAVMGSPIAYPAP